MTWAQPPELLTLVESFIKEHDLTPNQEQELLTITRKWGHEVIDFCSRERITGPRSIFVIFHIAEIAAKLSASLIAANTKKRFAQQLIEGLSKSYEQGLMVYEHEVRELLQKGGLGK